MATIIGDDKCTATRRIGKLFNIGDTNHVVRLCGLYIEPTEPKPHRKACTHAFIQIDERSWHYQSSEINAASFSAI